MSDTGAPPRVLIVIAAALAAGLAVVVGFFGLTSGDTGDSGDSAAPSQDQPAQRGPLPLVSIPAPDADSPECASLLAELPRELESAGEALPKRELAEPAPDATAAWGFDNPVVLRCGLDRPPELTRTSDTRAINDVTWLQVPAEDGTATWYVIDRPVYVALTVPPDTGTGPLQLISDIVGTTLPETPLRFD
ncbi:hypothetical protein BAY61_06450 [Prauserella marina]|uniref:Uncharacterized protein n=1 Tax=Prauserella marina TaxID=530584 RepID=A0A222VL77_9PSEU|nr:DUF3515 domain-containing protein [Prauserella marina]ASR34678.1 hypothetical protein BAY61_06450 [Prauserella marina]PWV85667.1 uncharacterized protein DUF3515 [Prauserella marina]SDC48950.1 Protein of unknown function [Prauserella marina]